VGPHGFVRRVYVFRLPRAAPSFFRARNTVGIDLAHPLLSSLSLCYTASLPAVAEYGPRFDGVQMSVR
jgi:hypothetical protein